MAKVFLQRGRQSEAGADAIHVVGTRVYSGSLVLDASSKDQ